MPKKIRDLEKMLNQAGFIQKRGKGSHRNWFHSLYLGRITISGKGGTDCKQYQEKEVINAIEEVKKRTQNE